MNAREILQSFGLYCSRSFVVRSLPLLTHKSLLRKDWQEKLTVLECKTSEQQASFFLLGIKPNNGYGDYILGLSIKT
jgi:hypothetical protein